MKAKKPQELYPLTAQRLNLPEEYVKDVVEFFYGTFKEEMFDLNYTIINNTGLGRFIANTLNFIDKNHCKNAIGH